MSADPPPLTFTYTNWRCETTARHVRPIRVEYGPEPKTTCAPCRGGGVWMGQQCQECRGTGQRLAWLLVAYDLDRQAERRFALGMCRFAFDKIGGAG